MEQNLKGEISMRDLTPNEKGKRADLRDADLFCEYRNDVPKLVEE